MVARVAGKQRNIFVIRQGGDVHAYVNWCPHNQVLIDQIPGQFFNSEKTMLRCSKHGALFQINDGLCVEGPCEGESLQPSMHCRQWRHLSRRLRVGAKAINKKFTEEIFSTDSANIYSLYDHYPLLVDGS